MQFGQARSVMLRAGGDCSAESQQMLQTMNQPQLLLETTITASHSVLQKFGGIMAMFYNLHVLAPSEMELRFINGTGFK